MQNFILSESATRLLTPFFMNLLKRFDEKIKPILKIYQLWVRVYKWRPVLIFDQRMCANFLLDVPHCVAGAIFLLLYYIFMFYSGVFLICPFFSLRTGPAHCSPYSPGVFSLYARFFYSDRISNPGYTLPAAKKSATGLYFSNQYKILHI